MTDLPDTDDLVLSHIYNNEDISQRQLVEKTNLSLGSINIYAPVGESGIDQD